MNSQNNNSGSNQENNVADNSEKHENIYSYSSKLPPQTEENLASNGEKGEVSYAKRSINDDIDDYKFVQSHRIRHHHHHTHSDSDDDTPLVQSSRSAKGSSHKKKISSTGKEKYLQEYDELVKSNHPAKGSKEQKKAIKEKHKSRKKKKRRLKKMAKSDTYRYKLFACLYACCKRIACVVHLQRLSGNAE